MESARLKNISILLVLAIAIAITLGFGIDAAKNLHFIRTQVGPAVERAKETSKELDEVRKEVESEIAELKSAPIDNFERLIELYKCDEELLDAEEQMLAVKDILIEAMKKNSRDSLALALQLLASVNQTISTAQVTLNHNKKSANIWRPFYFSPEISRRILLSQLPKV